MVVLQGFLGLLAVCRILNRQQDRPRLRIRIEDLAGVEQHHFPSDMFKFVRHLKVPEGGVRGENVLQQLAQFRDIPLSVPEVVDQTPLGLLRRGLERFVERLVGFHDLQVLVQDHQGLPHGFHDRFGEVKTALGGIDIDQHQHGAVGFAIRSHGGKNAQRIPAAVRVADIARLPVAALHRIQQQPPQVGQFHLRLKIDDRASDIGGDQIQHGLDGARKAANAQIPPDHHQGYADALEKIGQIPVDLAEFHVADLQLFVQRVQFFVGRFQLFLRGFQFLIARLRLFVRGPKFLQGGGMILDDRLQILFGCDQFVPQPGAARVVLYRGLGVGLRAAVRLGRLRTAPGNCAPRKRANPGTELP